MFCLKVFKVGRKLERQENIFFFFYKIALYVFEKHNSNIKVGCVVQLQVTCLAVFIK